MSKTKQVEQGAARASERHPAKPPERCGARTDAPDALSLLTADHEEVDGYFKRYAKLVKSDADSKELVQLAGRICRALTIHAQVEEELFYPLMRDRLDEKGPDRRGQHRTWFAEGTDWPDHCQQPPRRTVRRAHQGPGRVRQSPCQGRRRTDLSAREKAQAGSGGSRGANGGAQGRIVDESTRLLVRIGGVVTRVAPPTGRTSRVGGAARTTSTTGET